MIEKVGFTDVVLGIQARYNNWRVAYSTASIREIADTLRKMGCRVHLMGWFTRKKRFIVTGARDLCRISNAVGPDSIMLDAELHWHRTYDISLKDAVELTSTLFADRPCKLGVTGLARMHSTVKALLEVCDYGLPQAYSIWRPRVENHWSHSPATEPVTLQRTAWNTWSKGNKYLVMGLSCYWASRPDRFAGLKSMDQMTSMRLSIKESKRLGADQFAYWSLKHLMRDNRYAKERVEFLRSLKYDPGLISSVPR